ncbi:sigma-70 family RNA polymerase sigma factor [Streptomyces sp. JH34]|uniref:RNA polymerase sigma factor n=1 Tax=Streptomyces sp. JH34 TaxID=2793633 RepID=UPI0023F66309|nr:sigma-70 family RNA polymerase sigma factor [Streptomyces sp. JH34]MDF6018603.1 sigma-70 family RNA polymerase sigma factor [Streptomyces sp. JH34]
MSDPPTARRPGGPGNRWELIWSHRDELLELARARSSSAEEAEDAVQEAMIRAVEDPEVQYGRVRSRLRLATVRACADRRRQVARDQELSETLSAAPAEPFLVEEGACDRAEARWLADRSAELLPARQAQALRLQAQDLDVGQVARTMGLSYRATESLLARARRSLRNVLAGSLTLAAAVWTCARRFPRTGVAQSAGATSAAVTLAVAGAVLPAGPFDRPDGRPPESRTEAQAPPAAPAEWSTAGGTRPHVPVPSPDPQRTDRARHSVSPSGPEEPPRPYEPPSRVAVEISIETSVGNSAVTSVGNSVGKKVGAASPVPQLPPVAMPTSIPSPPVDVSDVRRPESPSAPSDTTTDELGVTVELP